MYIKELSITNYKSFFGEHIFRFNRGANIIIGTPGSGKTNLCSAIEFALFGGMSKDTVELSDLINRERVGGANAECQWVGCEVSLLFEDDVGEHRVERSFSLFGEDEAVEKTYYSMHLSLKISQRMYRDYVYVDEDLSRLVRERTGASVGKTVMECLPGLAERCVASGLGMMILDNPLTRLPASDGEKVFKGLTESGLDQVILLEDVFRRSSEESAYLLGETIESVTFKAEGFPFDPSHLWREIELMVWDSYVLRGDEYRREVYGKEYTVEAVEVIPDGARYRSGVSRLTVT